MICRILSRGFSAIAFAGIALMLVVQSAVAAEPVNKPVCLSCHASQQGKGGRPVVAWQNSIHAQNGISCNHCHGGDPSDSVNAMSPERGFLGAPKEAAVPAFCGRCHVGIRDDYLNSAHGRALGRGGPTCVTCHGSHDVRKVTLDLINEKRCSSCHPYARAGAIKEAMATNESRIVQMERDLARLRQKGVDTAEQEKKLFALKNRYHRLFHNVDVNRVVGEEAAIGKELDAQRTFLTDRQNEQHQRKVWGALVVGLLLLVALACHLLKKTYE
ncbi:multiheme c-type cytochrome [Geobacter argillaceus]|uniref:Cytochrome c3-like protein n=1 Tax=Geobacter argillaceus TaxID=345631 RepID=A0A562VPA9_9BACT|nr:multiheme c-type cytochrome [Geobacter argillaceus]TWJ19614.1 cytochrome c3-like protein [Geobacter argillaceus]